MKSRYLPLAGLLMIGTLGASDLTATAINTDSISGATIAHIERIADTIEIQLSRQIGIADNSKINRISSMAIRSIIDDEIRDNRIDSKIIEIDA